MNEVQSKAQALLKCFVEICDKINVSYYLVCGTALGAVKYQGFIPWDDDIDVGLLRPDYERFLREAPKYLPEHYFLQNYRTDPAFPQPYTKLRDSSTTFIETNKAHLSINHGIYIDVFPLDGYPKEKKEQEKLEWKKRILSWQWGCALKGKRSFIATIHCTVFRLLGCHKRTAKILKKYEQEISAYSIEEADVWCNHGNWQGKLEYADKRQYGQGAEAIFEGIKVRIPENFDAYLTQKYGDWRADLPEEQKKSHHFNLVTDAKRPYTYYINKGKGGK